jgi:hypothetical protein
MPRRLALCGPASPYFTWLQKVLTHLPKAFGHISYDVKYLHDAESTEAYFATSSADVSLLVSHYPFPVFVKYLEKEKIPTVICLSDPIDSIEAQMSGLGATPDNLSFEKVLVSTRVITQTLALLGQFVPSTGCAMVVAEEKNFGARDVLSLLCRELGCFGTLPVGQMMKKIDPSLLRFMPPAHQHSLLSAQDIDLVHNCCNGLVDFLLSADRASVFWPTRCFFNGDTFTSPAHRQVEMVGPARCIYYGPYFHLPIGTWSGHLTVGFTDLIDSTRIHVEVFCDEVIAEFYSEGTNDGVFNLPINFAVLKPQDAIQIRIFLDNGEIEGVFWFSGVALSYSEMNSKL